MSLCAYCAETKKCKCQSIATELFIVVKISENRKLHVRESTRRKEVKELRNKT